MKRALFISTSIPPATDMQTTRNMYLIRSLINDGFSVDVLTCGNYSKGTSSFDAILDKISIHRTSYPSIQKWHRCAQRILRNTPFLKLHNVLINYYAKPDLFVGWNKVAEKYIKDNDLFDYDIVITSSGGYSAHFVGNYWKSKTGKKWIAEYGDPWGLDSFGNINNRYYEKEKIMLRNCDGIVFTTQSTIDAYKNHYDINIPYCLTPCGYDEIIENSQKIDSLDKLVFTYTGVAYGKSRNLAYFLSAANCFNGLKVQIVGSYSNSLKQSFRESNTEFLGRVSYSESLNIISRTDVLVHIGNYGTMQIPGKTYIYLSSKKPILYIQQQEANDPTWEVLREFDGVVHCKNDVNSIKEAIDYIIANYHDLKCAAEKRASSERIGRYRWDKLGENFTNFVNRTIESE